MAKKVIGLVETVEVIGQKGRVRKRALLDTGATRSSVDVRIAAKAGLGPIVRSVRTKSASASGGYDIRPVAKARIKIKGRTIRTNVNLVDRSHMPIKVLIGRDVIHGNFLIDLEKTHKTHRLKDTNE